MTEATRSSQRIHIVGGPGSGKTRLATRVAARLGAPIEHLDNVARIGGGSGPLRPPLDRDRLAAEIASSDRWVTEGVHLGWTCPLMERADVILWLDTVSWTTAARRISRRFAEGGVREARSRRGRQRVGRFRDYATQLRALGSSVLTTRRYYATSNVTDRNPHGGDVLMPDGTPVSRATTKAHLGPYVDKVVHLRSAADVNAFLERLP